MITIQRMRPTGKPLEESDVSTELWTYALSLCVDALSALPAAAKNDRVLKALAASTLILDTLKVPYSLPEHGVANGVGGQRKSKEANGTASEDESLSESDDDAQAQLGNRDSEVRREWRVASIGAEILEQIFLNIAHTQYPNFALVNHNWANAVLRLLWERPEFYYTGSIMPLFKFYACQSMSSVRPEFDETGTADSRIVKQLTLGYWKRCEAAHLMSTLLLKLIASVPFLTTFEASLTKLTDPDLVTLAKYCPNLRELDLIEISGITPTGITAVLEARGPQLSRLNMSGCRTILTMTMATQNPDIFESFIDALAKCTSLRSLCLPGIRLNPAHLQTIFSTCLMLEQVDLSSTYTTDETIDSLSKFCPRLETLILDNCPNITNASIKSLATNSSALANLAVSSGKISDTGILALARARTAGLRRIVLFNNPDITDLSMQVMGRYCRQISIFDIAQCYKVTSSGLLDFLLGPNPPESPPTLYANLNHLNLTGTSGNINNATVQKALDICPNLRTLLLPLHIRGKTQWEVEKRCPFSNENIWAFYGQNWLKKGGIRVSARRENTRDRVTALG